MEYYETRPHLCCPLQNKGRLSYEETVKETVVLNKREVKRFGVPPKVKEITKDMFRCSKCHELVNVIVCPSWEDMVLSGKIRVDKWLYWKLKNDRKKREQRHV